MTADKARNFAWFWIVLCTLATINLILQVLVAAAPIRFVASILFVIATGWQSQRYWRKSVELRDDPTAGQSGAEPETPGTTPPPPPGASFAERLAWFQDQPHFKRTWIYLVIVSAALVVASIFFFILASQQGLGGTLALGIIWAVPATFFSVMTWRIRPGAPTEDDGSPTGDPRNL